MKPSRLPGGDSFTARGAELRLIVDAIKVANDMEEMCEKSLWTLMQVGEKQRPAKGSKKGKAGGEYHRRGTFKPSTCRSQGLFVARGVFTETIQQPRNILPPGKSGKIRPGIQLRVAQHPEHHRPLRESANPRGRAALV